MSNNRNPNEWGLICILFAALIVFSITVSISETLNLDLATSFNVFCRFLIMSAAAYCSLKFGDEIVFLRFSDIWPVFLGWTWICIWPALQYWATVGMPSFYEPNLWPTVWWNEWYGRHGVLISLIAGGYGIRHAWQNRY